MLRTIKYVTLFVVCLCVPVSALAQPAAPRIDPDLWERALAARDSVPDQITSHTYMTIIDYRSPSYEPRFFLIDLSDNSVEALLVAHGAGSDRNHDGYAEQFSNIPNSRMTSLGSYVTGATYHGRHGLSLRLHGLDPSNDNAERRAIVIHGADYVAPGRRVLGRSWGCPALENEVAQRVIPLIKDGTFVYIVGPDEPA